MCTSQENAPIAQRALVLTRVLRAPREKVFRAWTEPELMKRWFCPPPWSVSRAEVDLRPGGTSLIVMRGPDGTEMPCPGVYLEVVKNEKLVFTDAFVRAWEPSNRAFMVGTILLEDAGPGKTTYTAKVQHWTVASRDEHEKMGFYEGWGKCAEQLEEVAGGL